MIRVAAIFACIALTGCNEPREDMETRVKRLEAAIEAPLYTDRRCAGAARYQAMNEGVDCTPVWRSQ